MTTSIVPLASGVRLLKGLRRWKSTHGPARRSTVTTIRHRARQGPCRPGPPPPSIDRRPIARSASHDRIRGNPLRARSEGTRGWQAGVDGCATFAISASSFATPKGERCVSNLRRVGERTFTDHDDVTSRASRSPSPCGSARCPRCSPSCRTGARTLSGRSTCSVCVASELPRMRRSAGLDARRQPEPDGTERRGPISGSRARAPTDRRRRAMRRSLELLSDVFGRPDEGQRTVVRPRS